MFINIFDKMDRRKRGERKRARENTSTYICILCDELNKNLNEKR